jgi:hypothetical protein
MTILMVMISAVLLSLAGLHVLWGIGFWFPIRDEAALVRAVVGAKGATRMPGAIPCALVAVLLIWAAAAPWWGESLARTLSVWLFTLVFLGRGALAYLRVWRQMTPQEPFARLDRQYYGPLCLLLGLGFLLLALM